MRVTSLEIYNFRSFVASGTLNFGDTNVFVGPNNAGKSSLLRAIYLMQDSGTNPYPDVRVGAAHSDVIMSLTGVGGARPWAGPNTVNAARLHIRLIPTVDGSGGVFDMDLEPAGEDHQGVDRLPPVEPDHALVPFFSRRKVGVYQEDVRESHALRVSEQFDYLAARLSRLSNPSFPESQRYMDTCRDVLGFVVTAVPSEGGQRPGAYLADRRAIPLQQMGEGVPNIVGLLVELSLARDKILLIEEPENDLHPAALKALLELIEESAKTNQVFVSTHSNIVVRHLGSVDDSRVFMVDVEPDTMPPAAQVRQVEPTPEARLAVLRELGYSFSDFDLWDGWLILEEASAEIVIRDYLIPWFAPTLSRVRTLSAAGNGNVEPTFEDFHRLARFTHLEPAYQDAAWVRIDGDDEGRRIVDRLRDRYSSWAPDRFGVYSEAAFERYYPESFQDRVETALGEPDKRARRAAKKQLLQDVRVWIDQDRERGKRALAASAEPVIADLAAIEQQLADR